MAKSAPPRPIWGRIDAARRALARYPRSYDGHLRTISVGENATFRLRCPRGVFSLRIYRPGRWQPEQIRVEHAFMAHCGSALNVSPPLPGRDGETLQLIEPEGLAAALFPWTPGRLVWRSLRPCHLRRLGACLGALHRRARSFHPAAARSAWDEETLVRGPLADLRTAWPHIFPDRDLPPALDGVARRCLAQWRALSPREGFLHADLHFGNATFARGEVYPFDFDDCGRGPLAYELAVIEAAVDQRPDATELSAALFAGYGNTAPFDMSEKAVRLFARVRSIWLLGWLALRPEIFTPEALRRILGRELDRLIGSSS